MGLMGILGAQSYEGLPPEVGAFNFQIWPHAPWPVHIFGHFHHFCGNFGILGVGVIPWISEGWDGMRDPGPTLRS